MNGLVEVELERMGAGVMRNQQKGRRRAGRRLALVMLLAAVVTATGFGVARAQTTERAGKVRMGEEVVVPRDEVVQSDLYLFAGSARVDGTVRGDLVVFGGSVVVAGTVEGDIIAAGGEVEISGEAGGDVRVSGGDVRLSGSVAEDLAAAGGRVRMGSQASIAEDLIFAAGAMTLAGDVTGDVLGAAGNYTNTGDVQGEEKVAVGEDEEGAAPGWGARLLAFLRGYLALLVVGGLLILLARRSLAGAGKALSRRLPMSGLAGLLFLLAAVLALVAVFIVGLLLAVGSGLVGLSSLVAALVMVLLAFPIVVALALLLLWAWVAPTVVGVWLGSLALRGRLEEGVLPFAALAVGGLVILALGLIPVLGPLVRLVVFLLGTGALVLHQRRSRRRPAEAAQA